MEEHYNIISSYLLESAHLGKHFQCTTWAPNTGRHQWASWWWTRRRCSAPLLLDFCQCCATEYRCLALRTWRSSHSRSQMPHMIVNSGNDSHVWRESYKIHKFVFLCALNMSLELAAGCLFMLYYKYSLYISSLYFSFIGFPIDRFY